MGAGRRGTLGGVGLGVALGAWLLAEPIAPGFLAGAVLVLAGVMLVSSHGWLVQRWKMKSA